MLISEVSIDALRTILSDYQKDNWRKVEDWWGVAGSVEYGVIKLQKENVTLKFDYDNWTEGNIQGPDALVQEIKAKYLLK